MASIALALLEVARCPLPRIYLLNPSPNAPECLRNVSAMPPQCLRNPDTGRLNAICTTPSDYRLSEHLAHAFALHF